jgi:hypothetical protein
VVSAAPPARCAAWRALCVLRRPRVRVPRVVGGDPRPHTRTRHLPPEPPARPRPYKRRPHNNNKQSKKKKAKRKERREKKSAAPIKGGAKKLYRQHQGSINARVKHKKSKLQAAEHRRRRRRDVRETRRAETRVQPHAQPAPARRLLAPRRARARARRYMLPQQKQVMGSHEAGAR